MKLVLFSLLFSCDLFPIFKFICSQPQLYIVAVKMCKANYHQLFLYIRPQPKPTFFVYIHSPCMQHRKSFLSEVYTEVNVPFSWEAKPGVCKVTNQASGISITWHFTISKLLLLLLLLLLLIIIIITLSAFSKYVVLVL